MVEKNKMINSSAAKTDLPCLPQISFERVQDQLTHPNIDIISCYL
jgi:hypothetical protein